MRFIGFVARATMVLVVGCLVLAAVEVQAQGPARYTPPAGPTLPRELNYFRRDIGVLDQYNAFVYPQLQMNNQLQQLAAQQQLNYRRTQRQINELKEVRPSEASPTGVGATFMNYGHYYNLRPRGAAPARAR